MEADSTTYDNSKEQNDYVLPFKSAPSNYKLYKELTFRNEEKSIESQLINRFQEFGLIPAVLSCPTRSSTCKVISKNARVVDRVQWICEGCGKKQPIRTGTFFSRIQCSLLQSLQIILSWCEDVDCEVAAKHFDVKLKVAGQIYDKLDDIAVNELLKTNLGGENSVVLAEMYPECLNRQSPDTTEQPHVHRILMLADTNHIPTYYRLHVIREDFKKMGCADIDSQALQSEVETIMSSASKPDSVLVTGNNVPPVEGMATVHHLLQHCDTDMQHFLSRGIWRQAITVCAASRELCTGASPPSPLCASVLQRYLYTAMYRLRYGDGFFGHILKIIATDYTDKQLDIIPS